MLHSLMLSITTSDPEISNFNLKSFQHLIWDFNHMQNSALKIQSFKVQGDSNSSFRMVISLIDKKICWVNFWENVGLHFSPSL